MITFLINIVYNLLEFIINIFPTGTGFPSGFHAAIASLGGYLHILDPILPIEILLTCLTLIFTVELAIYGFKVFKWAFSYIPFIGGKG